MPTEEELQKGFVVGDWEVLPAKRRLRSGDREERPEPKVFRVLLALAMRDGDVVTRDELIDEIWEGRLMSDEPIARCLSQLRKHLGDKDRPYQYIETLATVGYRLNKKVELNEPKIPDSGSEQLKLRARYQGSFWMLLSVVGVAVIFAALMRGGFMTAVSGPGDEVQSIAVLPFENLSGDSADRYLVSGFKEELVQTLHNVPGLSVKHGRRAYPEREVSEIAKILGVDAVLFGAVQRDGNMLKISYQVARGHDGINISSGKITGQLEGMFALQERLALIVRNDILGESPQQLISSSRPAKFDAYDRYIRARYAMELRTISTNLEDAIALLQETIEIDPQFGPAYLSLATAYALLPDYRNSPLKESHELAIATVERGIAVDESIRDAASAVTGFVYHKRKEWSKAEEAYVRATTGQVIDPNSLNWYSRMLASVGRRNDALHLALEAQKMDPDSAVITSRVATVYAWVGDDERAAEFLQRAKQLGARSYANFLGNALLHVRRGEIDEASNLTFAAVSMAGMQTGWITPVFVALADPSQTAEAIAALDIAGAEEQLDQRMEIIVRAMLGDLDGAMRVANLLADPGQILELDLLFLPELRSLRQRPDFIELMERLGVKRYWDENECTWQGDEVSCPESFL